MTDLEDVARSAVAIEGIESAAVFVAAPGSSALNLRAAAGIEGPPLAGLIAAVADPRHPINSAMSDAGPTFDVRPMNPGGPALRSHLPLAAALDGSPVAVGVLAVAHEASLDPNARAELEDLAEAAAASVTVERARNGPQP
jgi:hypothetical protein